MRVWVLGFFVLLASPVVAGEEEDSKLTGSFGYFGEDCAENEKSANCNISITITGKAAESMYRRMKARVQKDECTGGTFKAESSGMNCRKDSDGYACDFGYSYAKKKFTNSNVTC